MSTTRTIVGPIKTGDELTSSSPFGFVLADQVKGRCLVYDYEANAEDPDGNWAIRPNTNGMQTWRPWSVDTPYRTVDDLETLPVYDFATLELIGEV